MSSSKCLRLSHLRSVLVVAIACHVRVDLQADTLSEVLGGAAAKQELQKALNDPKFQSVEGELRRRGFDKNEDDFIAIKYTGDVIGVEVVVQTTSQDGDTDIKAYIDYTDTNLDPEKPIAAQGIFYKPGATPAGAGAGVASDPEFDVNGDGDSDISDPVFLLNYLFTGGRAPVPLKCENAGGGGSGFIAICDDDGSMEVSPGHPTAVAAMSIVKEKAQFKLATEKHGGLDVDHVATFSTPELAPGQVAQIMPYKNDPDRFFVARVDLSSGSAGVEMDVRSDEPAAGDGGGGRHIREICLDLWLFTYCYKINICKIGCSALVTGGVGLCCFLTEAGCPVCKAIGSTVGKTACLAACKKAFGH